MPDVARLQRDLKASQVEVRRLRRALRIRQLAQPELQAWLSNAAMLERLVILSRDANPATPAEPAPVLSVHEKEVLAALVAGDSIPVLAAHLFISNGGARSTVKRIYSKLGVHNRAGAVMASIRYGLVQAVEAPDDPA